MNELIITFRETLETVLIVGIFYTIYKKLDAKKTIKTIWLAVGSALIASVAFAFGLIAIKNTLNNSIYEKLFESVLMYLAAGFLIYMILWMQKNSNIKNNLEDKAIKSHATGSQITVFFLIFFAIVREGFETALFLMGSSSVHEFSYLGFFTGIFLAIGIGYFIFIQGNKLPLKQFFKVTSFLLLFFAAGMIAYGTHEMEEFLVKSDVIKGENISRVWNILEPKSETPTNSILYNFDSNKQKYIHIMHDKGSVGVFLKGFFGYNSNPNYIEFIFWLLTLCSSFLYFKKTTSTKLHK